MFLDQYNKLINDMLNQSCALTELRAELEEREGRLCRHCRRFGHVAQKYRNEKEKTKKINSQNKKVKKYCRTKELLLRGAVSC